VPILEADPLQDKVKPFPFPDVQRIVEDELGARLSAILDVRGEADRCGVARPGASRGAARRTVVAVKIQRPDIEDRIREDGEAFEEIAELVDRRVRGGLDHAFRDMVVEFRKTLAAELDYRQEARNMETVGRALAGFRRIVVPQPVRDYTTARVLTMDYVDGTKLTALNPVVLTDVDTKAIADELFQAYLKQVLLDGVFHADPHPGNVFLTDDRRLALLTSGWWGGSRSIRPLLRFSRDFEETARGGRADDGPRPGEEAQTEDFRRAASGIPAYRRATARHAHQEASSITASGRDGHGAPPEPRRRQDAAPPRRHRTHARPRFRPERRDPAPCGRPDVAGCAAARPPHITAWKLTSPEARARATDLPRRTRSD
jgi:hypothetical protein